MMRRRIVLILILVLSIAALLPAAAQFENAARLSIAVRAVEKVFDNAGNPWPWLNQTLAVNYDTGGQGLAYNVPKIGVSPCATVPSQGTAYRTDYINLAVITDSSQTLGVGCNLVGNWMNYSMVTASAGPYVMNLRAALGDLNSATWGLYIDGALATTITVNNTGSYSTFQTFQSASFDVSGSAATPANHTVKWQCNTGNSTGQCGTINFFQAVAVGGLTVVLNPTTVSLACNSASGTQVTAVSVTGGNTTDPITLALSGADTSDFILQAFTPPTHVVVGGSGINSANCNTMKTDTVTATQSPQSIFDTTRNPTGQIAFSTTATPLTATFNSGTGSNIAAFTTRFHSSGAWVFDVKINKCTTTGGNCGVGLASSTAVSSSTGGNWLGSAPVSVGTFDDGSVWINDGTAAIANTGVSFVTGDVLTLAVDLTGKTLQVAKNGGALSSKISISSMSTFNLSPAVSLFTNTDSDTFNGLTPHAYTGYTAWDGGTAAGQMIASIAPPTASVTTATCAVGTTVAAMTATMNPPSPPFNGTWSPTTGDSHFTMSGANLQCAGTTAVPTGTYSPTVKANPTDTTIPSATQVVTVTVGSGGGPTVPPAAAKAGYNTLAANYDFSTSAYANPSFVAPPATNTGWLDCTGGDPTKIWHTGAPGIFSWVCDASHVMQTVDTVANGGDGSTVLQFHLNKQDTVDCFNSNPSNPPHCIVTMATTEWNTAPQHVYASYPNNWYIESAVRLARTNSDASNHGGPSGAWAWWTPTGNAQIEQDQSELYSDQGGYGNDGSINYNCTTAACDVNYFSTDNWQSYNGNNHLPPGWDVLHYHRYGKMVTSDGSTQMYSCTFIDDIVQNCGDLGLPPTLTFSGATAVNQMLTGRESPIIWIDSDTPPASTDLDLYIKYYRIWSCASWNGPDDNTHTHSCDNKAPLLTDATIANLKYYGP